MTMIYLAFTGFDAKRQRVPLTEPFYLDAMGITKRLSRSELMNHVSPAARQKVATLLQLSDDTLLIQNEPVHGALKKVGFVERSSDYAITPAYQAKFR